VISRTLRRLPSNPCHLSVVIYLDRADEWCSLDTTSETRWSRSCSLLKENIHAVGEVLSRSCNIRLPRYLPHFRAFHFVPRPTLAAEPLLSAATHFAKVAATNRDKSGVKQRGLRRCLFIFSTVTIPQLDVSLKCGELFVFPARCRRGQSTLSRNISHDCILRAY